MQASGIANLGWCPKCFRQDGRDLRASKLYRKRQALAQPAANFRAADTQAFFRPMSAASLAGQSPAATAVVYLTKEERLYVESGYRKALDQDGRRWGRNNCPPRRGLAPQ